MVFCGYDHIWYCNDDCLALSNQQSAISSQQSAVSSQHSEFSSQHSAVSTIYFSAIIIAAAPSISGIPLVFLNPAFVSNIESWGKV